VDERRNEKDTGKTEGTMGTSGTKEKEGDVRVGQMIYVHAVDARSSTRKGNELSADDKSAWFTRRRRLGRPRGRKRIQARLQRTHDLPAPARTSEGSPHRRQHALVYHATQIVNAPEARRASLRRRTA